MMNRGYAVGRIVLTVLIAFFAVIFIGASTAKTLVEDSSVYEDIIIGENLSDKVYEKLETDFKNQYNTTAIPHDVYMKAVSRDWLEKAMISRAECNIDKLSGKESKADTDFSALEKSITDFFNEYAESINYEKDEVFEKKLSETIENAEAKIEANMDAFYMNTLSANGYLDKIARYIPYLNWLYITVIAILIALILGIAFMEKGNVVRRFYWQATGFLCGGIIMGASCIYLMATGFTGRFAVKDPVVFTAVTSLLDTGIMRLLSKSIIFAVLGIALIIWNIAWNNKSDAKQ